MIRGRFRLLQSALSQRLRRRRMSLISSETLADLRTLDTPTVCNALEVVAPDRRTTGFTIEPLVCARPQLPPIVGYA